ncbi:MAG: transcription elongation factor GreA [Holosporales bacterium]|jgi:transcription elongation factor GreA|nr:transcription elongation factor GreA [Holosporales bacterium]
MNKNPMTQEGFDRLQAELQQLKAVERPAIIQAIAEARAFGDLSENAEYQYARDKQSFIEGRIADLEGRLAQAEVIDVSKLSGKDIKFGASVCLMNLESEEELKYRIVGVDEANLEEGRISVSSPVARVLIGKGVGDTVEVHSPNGSKTYEVLSVSY